VNSIVFKSEYWLTGPVVVAYVIKGLVKIEFEQKRKELPFSVTQDTFSWKMKGK